MSPPLRVAAELPSDGLKVEGGTLRAARALGFGAIASRELPLLLVPGDAWGFLGSSAAPESFAELARRLGDATRLAAYAAFLGMTEEKQETFRNLGVPAGSGVPEASQKAVAAFLRDFPEYTEALDWHLFTQVVSIVSERGTQLPSGQRVVYGRSDLAKHSCSPNAVTEVLGEDGLREVRVIGFKGISENEEVTVSYVPEELLLQPTTAHSRGIRELRQGYLCRCTRCKLDGSDVLELAAVGEKLRHDLAMEDLNGRLQLLQRLDMSLPLAMASKARVRFKLAQVAEKSMPQEAIQLYQLALDETDIVLGQKGLRNASNIKRRLGQLLEQM